MEVSLEEISYDSLYLSRQKLPSGASPAPPDNGILKTTDTVESAGTSSHASTTLAVDSEPIGSRMLVTGVVEIDDFITPAALRQTISAPPVDGVSTAKDVFESSAAPSGHSSTLAEGSDALLFLANCTGGGVEKISGNSDEPKNTLRAPQCGSVLRMNKVKINIDTLSILSTVLAEGSETLRTVGNNLGKSIHEFSDKSDDFLLEKSTTLVSKDYCVSEVIGTGASVGVLTELGERPLDRRTLGDSGIGSGGGLNSVLSNLTDIPYKKCGLLNSPENGGFRAILAVKNIGDLAGDPKELLEGSSANFLANTSLLVSFFIFDQLSINVFI